MDLDGTELTEEEWTAVAQEMSDLAEEGSAKEAIGEDPRSKSIRVREWKRKLVSLQQK